MKKSNVSKKIYSILMASAMISQPMATAYAAASGTETPAVGTGALDLSMNLELPVKSAVFSVSLKNEAGNKSVTMQTNEAGTKALLSMDNIAPGSYVLSISSEGFATYTQEVVITKNTTTSIELHNSRRVNVGLAEDAVQHGVMAVGDVNADGIVNEADADALMSAIDAGKTEEIYDLNGDGKVDVADLAYVTMNYGSNVQATALSVLNATDIKPESKYVKEGDLKDLTGTSQTFVQFQPTNGEKISEQNPIELSLDIGQKGDAPVPEIDGIVIKAPTNTQNLIQSGTILVETAEGEKIEAVITNSPQTRSMFRSARAAATARIESDGSIVVNLGYQVAVKKVTITVTESSGSNLVDISQVQFVNGMENRIPAPELNIPVNIQLTQLSAGMDSAFRVSWDPQVNVAGYEVEIQGNGKTAVMFTTDSKCSVSNVSDSKVNTGVEYTIRVRSTNGEWKSPYSEPQKITLMPESAPSAPEGVNVNGEVESISVSWKNMNHTTSYSVFYKEKAAETDYTEIRDIKTNSYIISDLKPGVEYQVYVVGHNSIGSSPKSTINVATPVSSSLAKMPKYGLINTDNGRGQVTEHIKAVKFTNNTVNHGDEFSVVDNDPSTYTQVKDWDSGVHYGNFANPTVVLDKEYTVQAIRFTTHDSQKNALKTSEAAVRYYDKENNHMVKLMGNLQIKRDTDGKAYYEMRFPEPITSDQFQLCLVTTPSNITISEMKFYYYDGLAKEIDGLYTDNLHLSLREGVTEDTIKALREKLDTVDPTCNEYHPDRVGLHKELDNAMALLNQQELGAVIPVNTKIAENADSHLDFGNLSSYQPIGKVAKAGDTMIVYVGSAGKREGDKTDLKLVTTQHHAEWTDWNQEIPLHIGKNEITIPNITNRESENGGSVYISWTGNSNTSEKYSIRVNGGTDIPMLDVTDKMGEERKNAIDAYMAELQRYVSSIENQHNTAHTTEHGAQKYSARDCILNHTEIVMKNMMYSIPASEVLSKTGGDAEKMEKALEAMEQELDLFFQHKGLNKNGTDMHRYPVQRLNIRYHKMFEGAFMYAGGKHIGIEFDSIDGLFGITPITANDKGTRIDGQLTGWGIAHEIGHIINNSQYTVAEITNNYYSILSTGNPRSDYKQVHKAVTGGKMEDSGLQMAMYWQLHMAYDKFDTFKLFDDYNEQMDNLFFARVDAYSREPKKAPHGLKLTGSKYDKLIRLSCAAANKNLLEFFTAWGLPYNSETAEYARQFEKETRKIQYLTPDAHKYKVEDGTGMDASVNVNSSDLDYTTGENTVRLTLEHNGNPQDMLGYEIIRNGKPVAFVDANETEYVDTITTGNNRAYTYEVIGYDKLLNTTEKKTMKPVKVMHNGSIDRSKWNISTNMKSLDDKEIIPDENNGHCKPETVSTISRIINGSKEPYIGEAPAGETAEIVLDFGSVEQVTAIEYLGGKTGFTVSVSKNGQGWTQVKSGEFTGEGKQTFYFEDTSKPNFMSIYDADQIKIELDTNAVSIEDIQILGPTSDNVELLDKGFGRLKEAFQYGYNAEDVIPAGSLVFTGSYKGNPAYNVVLIKDENGKIVSGSQIILANDPQDGQLGNVSDGRWVYWIEPDKMPDTLPSRVMAELYRVDNAETNENSRLVSDTLYLDIPSDIPEIKLEGNIIPKKHSVAMTEIDPSLVIPVLGENSQPMVPIDPDAVIVVPENTEDSTDTEPTKPERVPMIKLDPSVVITAPENAEKPEVEDSEAQESETENPQGIPMTQLKPATVITTPEADLSAKDSVPAELIVPSTTVQGDAAQQPDANKVVARQVGVKPANLGVSAVPQTASLTGKTVQVVDVAADQNGNANFSFHPNADKTKAVMQLDLGGGKATETLAFQTSFTVSDGVTGVDIEWSDVINQKALLKECRYNAETKTVTVYVTAERNLLDDGALNIGEISMKTSSDVSSATLELKPSSTVIVDQIFASENLTNLSGDSVDLTTTKTPEQPKPEKPENGNSSGGSSSSGSNSSSGGSSSSSKPDKKPEKSEKPDTQATTPETESVDITVFTDVAKDAWYYKSVEKAIANGWFNGTSDTTFEPNSTMTRAMFVTVLGRFGVMPEMDANSKFKDVPADSYFAKAVTWASTTGIINGVSADRFAPNEQITREQLAVMIHKFLKANEINLAESNETAKTFVDDSAISDWAKESVQTMQKIGIINGSPDGKFNPQGSATRAEVATILSNLESKISK